MRKKSIWEWGNKRQGQERKKRKKEIRRNPDQMIYPVQERRSLDTDE